ncbi:mCG147548 [Mus musculus]|nr:mCG147548 [Mus musculus]
MSEPRRIPKKNRLTYHLCLAFITIVVAQLTSMIYMELHLQLFGYLCFRQCLSFQNRCPHLRV